MYYHTRKNFIPYLKMRKKDTNATTCPFCSKEEIASRIIEETPHCYVIKNRLAYDQWELRPVEEHLLLLPKAHVDELAKLSPQEMHDYAALLAKYEAGRYEIYMRATTNIQRSVAHQHTHLIKTGTRRARGMIFLRKPYILWRLP